MISYISRNRIVAFLTLVALLPVLSLPVHAETLKFAWPDGATAKVTTRSQGRRANKTDGARNWDMTAEFTMRVQKNGDRIVISREGYTGWKGTFPPSMAGGADRFVDMIPTTIVSTDGTFIGIEGQEIARKRINQALAQSGPLVQTALQSITSDASLTVIATDNWSTLMSLWQEVELDPAAFYELQTVTPVPQLGGGELEITGTVRFVKETPCGPGQDERRCVAFHGETAPNKKQMNELLQSVLKKADPSLPKITLFDQRFKVDIVLDKQTMLPQQLTITRVHNLELDTPGANQGFTEEITKSYTFAWVLKQEDKKVSP
ncbi:MAG TPA: hypothetical protein VJT15_10235 [Pyrinomonadaceae bacterium]|nr:hypothetical protein [Pyrinomonadaceae bacterium]